MNRRTFLSDTALCGAGLTITASLLTSCSTTLRLRGEIKEQQLRIPLAEFKGQNRAVVNFNDDVDEKGPILVILDEKPRAFSMRCTHKGCIVRVKGEQMACPCHGSGFNFNGEALNPPATQPLPAFEVRIVDDHIEILLA